MIVDAKNYITEENQMTNAMTMSRSNLVLPTTGVELDREEMSYIEGGGSYSFSVRISAETVGSLIGAGLAVFIASCVLAAVGKAAKVAWTAGVWGFAIIAAAGIVGGIIGAILGNILQDAYRANKGIDFNIQLANSWLIGGNNTLFALNF
jgi:hypothetical protein